MHAVVFITNKNPAGLCVITFSYFAEYATKCLFAKARYITLFCDLLDEYHLSIYNGNHWGLFFNILCGSGTTFKTGETWIIVIIASLLTSRQRAFA